MCEICAPGRSVDAESAHEAGTSGRVRRASQRRVCVWPWVCVWLWPREVPSAGCAARSLDWLTAETRREPSAGGGPERWCSSGSPGLGGGVRTCAPMAEQAPGNHRAVPLVVPSADTHDLWNMRPNRRWSLFMCVWVIFPMGRYLGWLHTQADPHLCNKSAWIGTACPDMVKGSSSSDRR